LEEATLEKDRVYAIVRETTEPLKIRLEDKQKELVPFSEEVDKLKNEYSLCQSQLNLSMSLHESFL
jgi:hypothetical protein